MARGDLGHRHRHRLARWVRPGRPRDGVLIGLVVATVLAVLLVPRLDLQLGASPRGAGSERPAAALVDASDAVEEPVAALDAELAAERRRQVVAQWRTETERRSRELAESLDVGVASFNVYRDLPIARIREDVHTLVDRPGLDIVGWQEAEGARRAFDGLPERGWATRWFGGGGAELPVSWRRATFEFVSARQWRMASGYGGSDLRLRFADRYVVQVTLRHRRTGRALTLLNAHLPQGIEDLDRPGTWTDTPNARAAREQLGRMQRMWNRLPGRWTLGTGDFNFHAGDPDEADFGAPFSEFRGRVVSSYEVLGAVNVEATHPTSGRFIDYVFVGHRDVQEGATEIVGQRTLGNLNSDHRAVVVRLKLTP